ncbi:hypothetical protein IQ276_027900 [Desmonostoc muscorum LEGE 12446]|uniref:Uncharacterized protein n=1 Tax=Desmonostoc muscorum LEGE 12446 TaxID=1828758 RepID=A0A8J7D9N4_DESMC|nr:hypothetical protein [Desmonostoc muscorum]MCF2150187.1 hypothetical protein [Desmonostoc muscorum LEGE 12446]
MFINKSNKLNWLHFAALSTLAITFVIAPANALPGQNINTVLNWVKTKPQLPTLQYGHETLTYYGIKGNLSFHVTVPQKIVTQEGISVNGDSKLKFTKKNVKAVKLLQDIYGSNIANDFKNSRYVTKIAHEQFYRGQKFAYSTSDFEATSDASSTSAFQIIPLNNLQQNIDSAKYCQTNQCDI